MRGSHVCTRHCDSRVDCNVVLWLAEVPQPLVPLKITVTTLVGSLAGASAHLFRRVQSRVMLFSSQLPLHSLVITVFYVI